MCRSDRCDDEPKKLPYTCFARLTHQTLDFCRHFCGILTVIRHVSPREAVADFFDIEETLPEKDSADLSTLRDGAADVTCGGRGD
jgi:hypothetical protein